jgi:hypothetical protein
VGVTARLVVVVALVGAGFALGYVIAPHHAGATGDTATSEAATRAAHVQAVSIRAPADIAAVPALARGKHPAGKSTSHAGPPGDKSGTNSNTGPAPSSITRRHTPPQAPADRSTQPKTTPNDGTDTNPFDPFNGQPHDQPNGSTSTGTTPSSP